MGFNITFYKIRPAPKERMMELICELRRQQPTPKIERKIKSIEKELDTVKYKRFNHHLTLTILNLTYNYSIPECKEYWYGRRDYHGKTVGEAREIMLNAIERMEMDGIVPNEFGKNYVRPTRETMTSDLLMWLKITYSDLENMDENLLIKLE
jgi:hypothetical protein